MSASRITLLLLWLGGSTSWAGSVDWAEAPSGLEQRALESPNFQWQTIQGESTRVHYSSGTFAARHIAALARSADTAVEIARDLVGGEPYDRPVDVFYVDSREQMAELVPVRATGYADWNASAVFLVCNPTWRSFDVHEIVHVVSINTWGEPAQPFWWIREGLAVQADGRCREHAVQAVAAEYLRRGELPSPSDLIHHFDEVGELPGYLGSGSFVGFLLSSYGVEAVRDIWQRGGDEIEAILGVTLDDLDTRWRDSLRTIPSTISASEWEQVITVGCG